MLATTRTNARGQYGFANVPVGACTIRCSGQSDVPLRVQAGKLVKASFGKARHECEIRKVEVDPNQAHAEVGATVQFTATAYDYQGYIVAGLTFDWSSRSADIATVDANGLATASAEGTTKITAQIAEADGDGDVETEGLRSVAGWAMLHVGNEGDDEPDDPQPGPVAGISIEPDAAEVEVGGTVQFRATAYDAEEREVEGVQFTWCSSCVEVATVEAGLATGVAAGDTTIKARLAETQPAAVRPQCEDANEIEGSAILHVTGGDEPGPPASVVVEPQEETVAVGGTVELMATAYDAEGNPLPDTDFVWTTSDEEVATVTQDGVATGQAQGTAEITARVAAVGEAGVRPQCTYIQDSTVLHVTPAA